MAEPLPVSRAGIEADLDQLKKARTASEGRYVSLDDLASRLSDSRGWPSDAAARRRLLLLLACDRLGAGPTGDAARALFGLSPGTRGTKLGRRRALAADYLGIQEETFRRAPERRLIAELATELLVLAEQEVRLDGAFDLHRNLADASAEKHSLFNAYRKLYDVPLVTSEYTLQDSAALEYCRNRSHFVVIMPYSSDGRVLLERTFAGDTITWSLLGGSLLPNARETFIEAASRHARLAMPSIELADIEPVAFMNNRFLFGGSEAEHHGVAFIGRVRNSHPAAELATTPRTRAQFVQFDEVRMNFSLDHNERVAAEAYGRIAGKPNIVPFHDIEISENIAWASRYRFHDRFVKPALRLAGKRGFENTLEELDQQTWRLIGQPNSFVDVACGENSLCQEVYNTTNVELVVGNDVSWSQIELMQGRADTPHTRANGASRSESDRLLLYTNHDATNLPFPDDIFDVAICKNVLHHMPNRESVVALIQETCRISKRALIIEVMNPAFESRWGRIRHRYYLDFLHDSAVHFYSSSEFEEVTASTNRIERFDIRTVRGVYQFAVFQ